MRAEADIEPPRRRAAQSGFGHEDRDDLERARGLLGPTYTWPTEVYFLGSFDGETLDGDLALKGYGDPYLVHEEVWKLLRALRRTGLTETR